MREVLSGKFKNLKYQIRVFFGSRPLLFDAMKGFSSFGDHMTSSKCHICIEGFPRSANSYAVAAFRMLNPGLKISHHVHVPMQVIKAVELNIPSLTLIRNPADALASLLLVDKRLSYSIAIRSYISFYKDLEKVKKRIVVAEFLSVKKDFPKVIGKINEFYGTAFSTNVIGPDQGKEIFDAIGSHHKKMRQPENLIAVPTEKKERLKEAIKESLLKHQLLPEAEKVYHQFLKEAV